MKILVQLKISMKTLVQLKISMKTLVQLKNIYEDTRST